MPLFYLVSSYNRANIYLRTTRQITIKGTLLPSVPPRIVTLRRVSWANSPHYKLMSSDYTKKLSTTDKETTLYIKHQRCLHLYISNKYIMCITIFLLLLSFCTCYIIDSYCWIFYFSFSRLRWICHGNILWYNTFCRISMCTAQGHFSALIKTFSAALLPMTLHMNEYCAFPYVEPLGLWETPSTQKYLPAPIMGLASPDASSTPFSFPRSLFLTAFAQKPN